MLSSQQILSRCLLIEGEINTKVLPLQTCLNLIFSAEGNALRVNISDLNAESIPFTPPEGMEAEDVQAAIEEVNTSLNSLSPDTILKNCYKDGDDWKYSEAKHAGLVKVDENGIVSVYSDFPPPGAIASSTMAEAGSGYLVDDVLTVLNGNNDAKVKINSVALGSGVKAGTFDFSFGLTEGLVLEFMGGEGNGLQIRVDSVGGMGDITGFTIITPGEGYKVSDYLMESTYWIDFTVTELQEVIDSYTVTEAGTACTISNNNETSGGTGTGFKLNITDIEPTQDSVITWMEKLKIPIYGEVDFPEGLTSDGVAVILEGDPRLLDDATLVHKAGTETITGDKDFTGALTVSSNAVIIEGDSRLTDSRNPLLHELTGSLHFVDKKEIGDVLQVESTYYTYESKFGSNGTGDGQFRYPGGIAIDGSKNIFVTDRANNRVQKFNSSGVFQMKFGSNGTGDGQFQTPYGIAIDGSKNIFVTDRANNRVQKFNSSGVFQMKFGSSGSGDGQFNQCCGIAIDGSKNIFVTDRANNRVQKFNSSGVFQMKFGSNGTGDGQFRYPEGIAIDGSGNIFVVDTNNHRVQKFNSAGEYQSQFGSYGIGDRQFEFPWGITIDSSGNIFVTDNNKRIQKFNSSGVFQMKFGSNGTGDGQFQTPYGIAIDTSDNVFIVDNDRHDVQKFILQSSVGFDKYIPPTIGSDTDFDIFDIIPVGSVPNYGMLYVKESTIPFLAIFVIHGTSIGTMFNGTLEPILSTTKDGYGTVNFYYDTDGFYIQNCYADNLNISWSFQQI